MRASSPQLAILDATSYQVGYRVLIADGDGTMRDYSDQFGHNWIAELELDHDVDAPVSQATIKLFRDIVDGSGNALSLSPLRSDSIMNRNAATAFSPAIDSGRAVKVLCATTPVGTAPTSGDWQNLFEGFLDDFDVADSPLTLTARDAFGARVDCFIEAEKQYGSDVGVAMETVIQAIDDDNLPSPPTLYVPSSPGYDIKPYQQQEQSVMDAEIALVGLIGWDARSFWDQGTSAWRPTLQEPPRAKTTPDRTYGPGRYFKVQTLKVGRSDVRNAIRIKYTDSGTGQVATVDVSDSDSIEKYGRRFIEIDESTNSPINTSTEATAMANSILADLKDPKADFTVEMPFDWSVEIWDLLRFSSNSVHFNGNQDWAIVSVRHTLSASSHRTSVSVRGKPCGRYLGWLRKANQAVSVQPATATIALQASTSGLPRAVTVVGDALLGTASSVNWTLYRQAGAAAATQIDAGTHTVASPTLPVTVEDYTSTDVDILYTLVVTNPATAVNSIATVTVPRLTASVYDPSGATSSVASQDVQRGQAGTPNASYTTAPVYDPSGETQLVDTGAHQITLELLAADGKQTPPSIFQQQRDTAYSAGSAATGMVGTDDARSGVGGVPTADARYSTLHVYDAGGTNQLIDTETGQVTSDLAGPSGTAFDAIERGSNKGDAALDGSNRLTTGVDTSATIGSTAAGTVESGANKADGALDGSGILVTGVDVGATIGSTAAGTVETGANKADTALNSSNRLTTGLQGDQNSLNDLYFTSTQTPRVGSAGSPSTLTKTIRIPHAEFVAKDSSQGISFLAGRLSVTTALSSATATCSLVLPKGVVIVGLRARVRAQTIDDLVNIDFYKNDDSGTATALTARMTSATSSWQTLSQTLTETVGNNHYTVQVVIDTHLSGTPGADLAWLEIDYQMGTYQQTL